MKVLATGGCGFIGSNFIKYLLTDSEVGEEIKVINVDKRTYAGKGENISHMGLVNDEMYQFYEADISDSESVEDIMKTERPDYVVNFAAESHVDRSHTNPNEFVRTNVEGTLVLLEAVKKRGIERFLQVSTDEVYGSLSPKDKPWKESGVLNPRNPYSASKASAEHFVSAYNQTHEIPVVMTRSSNNFGPYQFPEKILPKFITNLINGERVPLMWSAENPGLNVRDWLHVEDNCRAIYHVLIEGEDGEVYNIPGENERRNIDITNMLLEEWGVGEEMIERIPHRAGHDFRYSINGDKLKTLGFEHRHTNLEREIEETVEWYRKNGNWWRRLLE
jgi:dTDP-glucose 4,6-dehydratase